MEQWINLNIGTNRQKAIYADCYAPKGGQFFPTVVFCHGFKGFKDWGPWHVVAQHFVNAGFTFIKFNGSHNGIGHHNFEAFTDLEGFAQNTYTTELEDLYLVLEKLETDSILNQVVDLSRLFLIGHSRGGGIALTVANELPIIKKVATWASIADFNRFGNSEDILKWEREGVKYVLNGRTKQNMPMNYSFYEDYLKNQSRLDLTTTVQTLKQPLLIAHGKDDGAVGHSHALRLNNWHKNAELLLVENANHVFDATHPFTQKNLPSALQTVVDATIKFFKK